MRLRPAAFIIHLCAVLFVGTMDNTQEMQEVQTVFNIEELQDKVMQKLGESIAYNTRSYFQLQLATLQLKRIRKPSKAVANAIKEINIKLTDLLAHNEESKRRIIEYEFEFSAKGRQSGSQFKKMVANLRNRSLEGSTPNVASADESADEMIVRLVDKGLLTLQGSEPAGVEDYDEDTGEKNVVDDEPIAKRIRKHRIRKFNKP